MSRPMVLIGSAGEFRAGWIDAERTFDARVWSVVMVYRYGRRFGDQFYAAGYALGALR